MIDENQDETDWIEPNIVSTPVAVQINEMYTGSVSDAWRYFSKSFEQRRLISKIQPSRKFSMRAQNTVIRPPITYLKLAVKKARML